MRASVLWLIAAALAGCTSAAEQLRPRAAFDLQCPPEQLSFVDLGGLGVTGGGTSTQGVTGCGKRATYVSSPSGWIMNTAQFPGQPQPGIVTPGNATPGSTLPGYAPPADNAPPESGIPRPQGRNSPAMFTGGIVMMATGLAGIVAGSVLIASARGPSLSGSLATAQQLDEQKAADTRRLAGGVLLTGSAVVGLVGIPIWLVGAKPVAVSPALGTLPPALVPEVRIGAGTASVAVRF